MYNQFAELAAKLDIDGKNLAGLRKRKGINPGTGT